jgi:hypothetical protein
MKFKIQKLKMLNCWSAILIPDQLLEGILSVMGQWKCWSGKNGRSAKKMLVGKALGVASNCWSVNQSRSGKAFADRTYGDRQCWSAILIPNRLSVGEGRFPGKPIYYKLANEENVSNCDCVIVEGQKQLDLTDKVYIRTHAS